MRPPEAMTLHERQLMWGMSHGAKTIEDFTKKFGFEHAKRVCAEFSGLPGCETRLTFSCAEHRDALATAFGL